MANSAKRKKSRSKNAFDFEWNKKQSVRIEHLGFGKELNKATAEIFQRYMFPYIPYDTGALANKVRIVAREDSATIQYLMPYFRDMYTGVSEWGERYTYHRTKHPLATSYWDKECWKNDKQKILLAIDRERKRRAK